MSIGEYKLERSVSVRTFPELIVGDAGRQSYLSAKPRTRFAYQWPDNVKCISNQILIKIYRVVQEL